jgi:hypothetical protein
MAGVGERVVLWPSAGVVWGKVLLGLLGLGCAAAWGWQLLEVAPRGWSFATAVWVKFCVMLLVVSLAVVVPAIHRMWHDRAVLDASGIRTRRVQFAWGSVLDISRHYVSGADALTVLDTPRGIVLVGVDANGHLAVAGLPSRSRNHERALRGTRVRLRGLWPVHGLQILFPIWVPILPANATLMWLDMPDLTFGGMLAFLAWALLLALVALALAFLASGPLIDDERINERDLSLREVAVNEATSLRVRGAHTADIGAWLATTMSVMADGNPDEPVEIVVADERVRSAAAVLLVLDEWARQRPELVKDPATRAYFEARGVLQEADVP